MRLSFLPAAFGLFFPLLGHAMDLGMDPQERRIYVVGSTGKGKSSFLNYLFEKPLFEAGCSTQSITRDVSSATLTHTLETSQNPIRLVFHDTPGLNDTNPSLESSNQLKIIKSVSENRYISTLIFLFDGWRADYYVIKTMNFYRKFFGPLFEKNQVLYVRTKLDQDAYSEENDWTRHQENIKNFLITGGMLDVSASTSIPYYWLNVIARKPKFDSLNSDDDTPPSPSNFFRVDLERKDLLSKKAPLPNLYTYMQLQRKAIFHDICQCEPIDFSSFTFPLPPPLELIRNTFVDLAFRCFDVVKDVVNRYNEEDSKVCEIILKNLITIKKTQEELCELSQSLVKDPTEIDHKQEIITACLKRIEVHKVFFEHVFLSNPLKAVKGDEYTEKMLLLLQTSFTTKGLGTIIDLLNQKDFDPSGIS